MRKTTKRILSGGIAAMMAAGMMTSALALDQKVYFDGVYDGMTCGMEAEFTIKNAIKKLDPVTVESDWGTDSIVNHFEGNLSTTMDVSGMFNLVAEPLEKKSDGSYKTTGLDGNQFVNNYVTWDADEVRLEEYANSAAFKEKYEENEYLHAEYPTFERYKARMESLSNLEYEEIYTLSWELDLKGFDKGSYFQFTKPGVYYVTATKGLSPLFIPFETHYAVLTIKDGYTPVSAVPTASKVKVDGKDVAFDAYNIADNNYFKLRDVAQVVSGTDKQFEVTWDADKNAIDLISGKAYTPAGGELAQGDGKAKSATENKAAVYLNGETVNLTAYNISGNNYFKLRDLGEAFDFEVSWDAASNTVVVNTGASYTAP